jgi:hypothetical protein
MASFDPTSGSRAVLRYIQLGQQLNQLRQMYTQIVRQYNLAVHVQDGAEDRVDGNDQCVLDVKRLGESVVRGRAKQASPRSLSGTPGKSSGVAARQNSRAEIRSLRIA